MIPHSCCGFHVTHLLSGHRPWMIHAPEKPGDITSRSPWKTRYFRFWNQGCVWTSWKTHAMPPLKWLSEWETFEWCSATSPGQVGWPMANIDPHSSLHTPESEEKDMIPTISAIVVIDHLTVFPYIPNIRDVPVIFLTPKKLHTVNPQSQGTTLSTRHDFLFISDIP